ncbi:oxygenase [Alcanivorax sp. N3-2A]|nr:oxygenase [Alcanivorax sp. N3-2A]|tara:strand:- start:12806 stop:14011 length:1206 start_codon:yes stop_codon:yes gene_type:complete
MTLPFDNPRVSGAPLIIGGGMAGALLALLLRHHGAPAVTLVESHALGGGEAPDTPSFDARSTALSAGSLAVLAELGLLDALLERAAAIGTVHVSRQHRLGLTRIRAAEQGVARLGAVVENRWFGHVLLSALGRDPAIRVRAPARLSGITRAVDGYTATLESDAGASETLHTPLLIAADGAHSQTREWLGIGARHRDLGHDAVIANLALATPHQGIAYERFLDDGPLALLPLPDQRFALVWTGPREQAAAWMAMDESAFLAALRQRVGADVPALTRVGERQRYPLVLTEACAQAVPFAAVVGNAAHTLHPVAGQGFNLTVRDLALLAERVGGQPDPGRLSRLQHWTAERQRDQALIHRASHWLPEWFRVRQPLFAHSRQLGLLALDLAPSLRKGFARRAMGL